TGRFLRFIGYVLFFLMIVFPMVLELLYVKAFLFILLLYFLSIATIKRGRLALHPTILILALCMISVSLFFSLMGIIANTPGALKQAQVYALWPLIYIILITGVKDSTILEGLQQTLVVATIFLAIYGTTQILTNLLILPEFFHLDLFKEESSTAFGFYEGFTEIRIPGLNSLPFLIPFCMAALVTWLPGKGSSPMHRIWLWIALLLGIALSIISGRKAVWLVIMLSPVLILSLWLLEPKAEKRKTKHILISSSLFFCLLLISVFVLLKCTYEFDLTKIYGNFISGFNFLAMDGASEIARLQQFYALLHGWLEHPLLGSGFGASAAAYGSIRSESRPWSYELYYLALLYQVGLVGFIIYASGIACIYYMGLKIIITDIIFGRTLLPLMVGMTGLFVASATNPYLMRFDGLWVIFLPIAVINFYLLKSNKKRLIEVE
ncbi:hypothetical protein KA005_77675, partial [bacterium]|nr:hypothetical protein [bacterium]